MRGTMFGLRFKLPVLTRPHEKLQLSVCKTLQPKLHLTSPTGEARFGRSQTDELIRWLPYSLTFEPGIPTPGPPLGPAGPAGPWSP